MNAGLLLAVLDDLLPNPKEARAGVGSNQRDREGVGTCRHGQTDPLAFRNHELGMAGADSLIA